MTNFEKYKDEVIKNEYRCGLKNGVPVNCMELGCEKCDLYVNCQAKLCEWLCEEYEG